MNILLSKLQITKGFILSLFLFGLITGLFAGTKSGKPEGVKQYCADWESIRSGYKIPEWFLDAKFGIFLHWGPYAVPAYSSEKYPLGMYNPKWQKGGMYPYTYHIEHYGGAEKFGYKDFFPMFKAEKFNADEWVTLFKSAGAKYVVPVGEHHDGYAMYNSHFTRWNAVKTGPHKDLVGALAEATRKQGLKFGVSSHFAYNPYYYAKTNSKWDTADPQYADLYGLPVNSDGTLTQQFLDLWWNRTTDIIDQYKPDLLWFDYGLDKADFVPLHKKILAYYYNKGIEWDKGVVFQDKNMHYPSFPQDLIVLDIERGRMDSASVFPWQTDTSIGEISWGYTTTEKYKPASYLLGELIDIVSKNGCLLLNIGPKADGTISDEAKAILSQMGAWLNPNSEAIFSTRPWKIFGEGPTKVSSGNHSEKNNKALGAEDFRFTTHGKYLYAISLGYAKEGCFIVKSLAKNNLYEKRAIKSVQLVNGKGKIEWKQTEIGLEIKTTGASKTEDAYAFKIKFK